MKRSTITLRFECPADHWKGYYETAMSQEHVQLHCRHCGQPMKVSK